ncbi:MAG TPA: XdhC/CoxI family protein [Candidatus Polarisedimenticolia bacterium]|nr:XdhC/CoxI family protein [Candidatus Polarisedimenticolia bacterium]
MTLAFYETLTRRLRSGRSLAVATLVSRQGSTPRGFGAKMIVGEEGDADFSIGGGAFEALVIEDAREAIREGQGFEKEYRFSEQGEGALGMVCGGSARVLFEVIRPPAPLLVFGGGHVGREVAHLGARLGFDVTLVDDRERFLDPRRVPEGVRLVRVEHDFSGDLPAIPRGAYVAIVTRCHRTDLAAVRHAVGRGAAYVGLIGSRRKIATVQERAEELGTPGEALAEVHGPIGLAIGAETPEEIGVSIAAEMIAVLRGAAADGSLDAHAGLRGRQVVGPLPAARTITPISRRRRLSVGRPIRPGS